MLYKDEDFLNFRLKISESKEHKSVGRCGIRTWKLNWLFWEFCCFWSWLSGFLSVVDLTVQTSSDWKFPNSFFSFLKWCISELFSKKINWEGGVWQLEKNFSPSLVVDNDIYVLWNSWIEGEGNACVAVYHVIDCLIYKQNTVAIFFLIHKRNVMSFSFFFSFPVLNNLFDLYSPRNRNNFWKAKLYFFPLFYF